MRVMEGGTGEGDGGSKRLKKDKIDGERWRTMGSEFE